MLVAVAARMTPPSPGVRPVHKKLTLPPLTDAQRELVTAHLYMVDLVAKYFQARWRSRQELAELQQEAFIGLARAAQLFEPVHESGATFHTYAWRGMVMRLRRWVWNEVNRDRPRGDGTAIRTYSDERLDRDRPPADRVAEADLFAAALRPLSPRWRRIVLRIVRDGATYREVGDELGVSHERVRQLYRRALKKAARGVQDLGPGDEEED